MILDIALIPLLFTNNKVNKPSDISVGVKPLTRPRYISTINCSSADEVWMHDVHTKLSENWPNALEVERLCVHTAWLFHNPVSYLQGGKWIKSPIPIHKAVASLSIDLSISVVIPKDWMLKS